MAVTTPTMASSISPIIGWILAIAQYYFAAATLSFIVLTFVKAMHNFSDQFVPTTNAKRKRENESLNLSCTSIKKTRNAQAISHGAKASLSKQNTKCTPPPVNRGNESNIEDMGASGYSLAPSSPQNKNSVHPHPPDLIDEEEPKEIRHSVDEELKSSTALPSRLPRCTISPQLVAAVAVLEAP